MHISSHQTHEVLVNLRETHESLTHDGLLTPARDAGLSHLREDLLAKSADGREPTIDDLAHARSLLAPTLLSATRRLSQRARNFEDTANVVQPTITRAYQSLDRIHTIERLHTPDAASANPLVQVFGMEHYDGEYCPEEFLNAFAALPQRRFDTVAAQRAYLTEIHSLIDALFGRISRIMQIDTKREVARIRTSVARREADLSPQSVDETVRVGRERMFAIEDQRKALHGQLDAGSTMLGLPPLERSAD